MTALHTLGLNSTPRPTLLSQYRVLFFLQLAKIRREWYYYFIIPAVISLGLIWLRTVLMSDLDDTALKERFMSGALLVAIMFGSVNAVANETAFARLNGEIEYLSTFPISRFVYVAATVTLPVLYTIPSVIVIIIAGTVALDLELQLSISLPATLAIAGLLFANVGLVVGLYLPLRLARSLASMIPLLLMMFSPVLVPPSEFPGWLRSLGEVLPTTHLAGLLQYSMFGTEGQNLLLRLAFVGSIAVILLLFVVRLPGWREDR